MQKWALLGVFALAWCSAQVSVQTWPESASFVTQVSTLDSALTLSQQLPTTLISLHPSANTYQITAYIQLSQRLRIHGHLQTILFSAQLEVLNTAELQIVNATLSAGLSPFPYINSAGQVLFEACVFQYFRSPLLFLASGGLEVQQSRFSSNSGTMIKAQGSDTWLRMGEVEVSGHSGSFLVVEPDSRTAGNLTVSLQGVNFIGNTAGTDKELLLVSARNTFQVATISFQSLRFEDNSVCLSNFEGTHMSIHVQNCSFARNSETAVHLSLSDSSILLSNSSYIQNSGLLFDISRLQGSLLFLNSSVSRQRKARIVYIDNSGPSDLCDFKVANSSFANCTLQAGTFIALSCQLTLTTSVISHVVDLSSSSALQGLFVLRYGGLSLVSMTISDSGSSTILIQAQMAALFIANSTISNPISGQRLMIMVVLSQINIQQSVISGGSIDVQNSGKLIGSTAIMYLSFYLSTVYIADLTVHNQRIYQSAICLQAYSYFNLTNIRLENMQGSVLVGMLNSTGSISGFTVVNCMVDYFLVLTSSNSFLTLSRVKLRDVNVAGVQLGCVLYSGLHSKMTVESLDVGNLAAVALLQGRQTQVYMKDVTVQRSNFTYLLSNILKSNVTIAGLRYEQSNGGFLFAIQAYIHLSDLYIGSICPGNLLMLGYGSSVVLQRTVLRDIIPSQGLGKFIEASKLTITDSDFAYFGSGWGDGFKVDRSLVTINNSSFSHFNVSLFQLQFSSILIQNFHCWDGFSPALFEANRLAYGGILGCLNCQTVAIDGLVVRNVSARLGGALAVRSTETSSGLVVEIANSRFESCRGNTGGAVYISKVGLKVANSVFRYNVANDQGGAIDVSLVSGDAIVMHSVFQSNSAQSGGGLHWHLSPVLFINTTFIHNSAYYGPDIASYGHSLRSNTTSEVVSGAPFDLNFELLDHYGQIVNLTTNTELRLQSPAHMEGMLVAVAKSGLFSLHGVRIYTKPGTSLAVQGATSEGKIATSVQLSFRNCTVGETYREDRCEYCLPGSVSFSPNDSECSLCPSSTFCPGGSVFIINTHYWRTSATSTKIQLCPLKAHCLGGNATACEVGYTGKLCTECRENWYRVRLRECEECPPLWLLCVQELLLVLLLSFFGLVIVKVSASKKGCFGLIALKVGIGHAQLLTTLSPLGIAFPVSIRRFLYAISFVSSLGLADLPLTCLGFSHPEYIKAGLASCLIPCLFLLYCLSLLVCSKPWKVRVTILITSSLQFTPLVIVLASIPLLVCDSIGTKEKWLITDMSELCWTNVHTKIITGLLFPSLIINLMLVLALIVTCLAYLPRQVQDKYFPLWVSGNRWRYWDVALVLYRIICLWLTVTIMAYHELIQLTSLLACVIVMEILTVSLRKWTIETIEGLLLTITSSLLLALSALLVAYYMHAEPDELRYEYSSGLAFVMLNSAFFFLCLYFVLSCKQVEVSTQSPVSVTREESSSFHLAAPNNSLAEQV